MGISIDNFVSVEQNNRYEKQDWVTREFDGVKNEIVMAGKGLKGKGKRNEILTVSRFPFPINQNKKHV